MENVRKVINPVSGMSHAFLKSVSTFRLPKEYVKSTYLFRHNKLNQVLIYWQKNPSQDQNRLKKSKFTNWKLRVLLLSKTKHNFNNLVYKGNTSL